MLQGVTFLIPIVVQLLDMDLFDPDDQVKATKQLTELLDPKKISNGQYSTCAADSLLTCPANSECYEVPQEDCTSANVCRTRLVNMCLERVLSPSRDRRDVSFNFTFHFASRDYRHMICSIFNSDHHCHPVHEFGVC